MKTNIVVVIISLLLLVGCASKQGAYYPVPEPRVIEKVVVKTDTVYIVKHDTIVLRDTIMLKDTIRVEAEKKVEVAEEPKIRVSEEKISLAEGEENTKLMAMKYLAIWKFIAVLHWILLLSLESTSTLQHTTSITGFSSNK